MNPQKTAVVVPAHSYIQHLPEALESVAAQTMKPGVTVCVLDHPENSNAYRQMLKGRPDVVVVDSIGHGVSAARNRGFEEALALGMEWVVPLDEDDKLWPTYLERMWQASRICPELQILYPDWTWFGGAVGYIRTPEYSYAEMLTRPYIIASAAIQMNIWQALHVMNGQGYDENLHDLGLRWEDYLFYLEAGALGVKMGRVGMALVQVRAGGEGGKVANSTREAWYEYASKKLGQLALLGGLERAGDATDET